MGIEKITLNAANSSKGLSKKAANAIGQAVTEITKKSSKKLQNSLDCLALAKKAYIKQAKFQKESVSPIITNVVAPDLTKTITAPKPMPTTLSFTKESIQSGLNAQEAVNGAKAAMSAISKPVGFSAGESAETFIKAGKSQLETKLDLKDKYADKLKEKNIAYFKEIEAERVSQELAKAKEILSKK